MIHIFEDIYIDADENNFMLIHWLGKRDKRGDLQGAHFRYYSSVDALLTGLSRQETRRAIASSVSLEEISCKLTKTTMIIETVASAFESIVREASAKARDRPSGDQ